MDQVQDYRESFTIEVVIGGHLVVLTVTSVADFWRVKLDGVLVVDAFLNISWYQGSTKQIDDVRFERITDALEEHFAKL